ncbi:hypothetical protein V5N11_000995 [Cardamine amara subsp. amara]|uniref:Uncharacterized protein n=1 Tax=Cardamine amara subsp. amara TaxID=228776 RepID=A0ABD0ZCH8_CARAN
MVQHQCHFSERQRLRLTLVKEKKNVKYKGGDSSLKVLPPWMIKEGMNLTGEQRGEVIQEANVDGGSGEASKLSYDKKSAIGNGDEKDLKDLKS